MTDYSSFDDIELSSNPDPRSPLLLILDASSSMTEKFPGESRTPMDALNAGLDILISELHKDPLAKRRVEVSVVVFGSQVAPATPFATVDNLTLPILEPMGITSMGAAVNVALDALEERKRIYKENALNYFKCSVVLITDGMPTDDITEAVRRVREAEERNSISFFAVGVEGADLEQLGKFSNKGALKLQGLKFGEFFQWLSASQAAVSASTPGDKISLPPRDGWAEF